jgi:Tfp pilus assembly pilus retraction ATPase PilT
MVHTLPEERRDNYSQHLLDTLTVGVAQRLLPHREGRIAVWEWLELDIPARRALKQAPLDQWEATINQLMAERGTRFVDQASVQRKSVDLSPAHSQAWDQWLGERGRQG